MSIRFAGSLVALALATGALASGASARSPSLRSGVLLAKRHVVQRYEIRSLNSVAAVRSKRNPRFALVSGHYRKPKRRPDLWTVYLRVRNDRWTIFYSGIGFRAVEPKVRVPCDIWPPFSEPSC